MYKIHNPYEECNILALNLMEASTYRVNHARKIEKYFFIGALACLFIVSCGMFMQDLTFIADCKNVMDGDICSIKIQ